MIKKSVNKELMEEAIAGFHHKRGRFCWQHGFSHRSYSAHVESAAAGILAAALRKYIGNYWRCRDSQYAYAGRLELEPGRAPPTPHL
jgi:hypothetical protein